LIGLVISDKKLGKGNNGRAQVLSIPDRNSVTDHAAVRAWCRKFNQIACGAHSVYFKVFQVMKCGEPVDDFCLKIFQREREVIIEAFLY
jgi:hypothetical protein